MEIHSVFTVLLRYDSGQIPVSREHSTRGIGSSVVHEYTCCSDRHKHGLQTKQALCKSLTFTDLPLRSRSNPLFIEAFHEASTQNSRREYMDIFYLCVLMFTTMSISSQICTWNASNQQYTIRFSITKGVHPVAIGIHSNEKRMTCQYFSLSKNTNLISNQSGCH